MSSGPYVYDKEQKTFVKRTNEHPLDGQVPVDPMAGSLAAIGAARNVSAPRFAVVYWLILAGMFVFWIVMIVLWIGQLRDTRETVMKRVAKPEKARSGPVEMDQR